MNTCRTRCVASKAVYVALRGWWGRTWLADWAGLLPVAEGQHFGQLVAIGGQLVASWWFRRFVRIGAFVRVVGFWGLSHVLPPRFGGVHDNEF
jgi:hypothetical protein